MPKKLFNTIKKFIKNNDPIVLWTCVLAVCGILNILILFLIWNISLNTLKFNKTSFNLMNRPFVGINKINTNLDTNEKILSFSVEIKNFGNVPAQKVELHVNGKIGDKNTPIITKNTNEIVIFPNNSFFNNGSVKNEAFESIINDKEIFKIEYEIIYFSPNNTNYKTYQHIFYDIPQNKFTFIDGKYK